jgi:two-component system sensor histidine kinase PilS (NtrC family)
VDLIATFTELQHGNATNVLILLEDATLTAQRAQQLKLASLGRLTASIAHEIRNPLGAISHAGQLLAESPSISAADNRLTQIIVENSQRVNSIIDNILQLSRRGQTNILPIDLPPWLNTFVEEFASFHQLPPNAVAIHSHHASVKVAFDPIHLYQVLTNLCENGLRYSQGIPLLELTLNLSEGSQRAYLDVRDHGKGMTGTVRAQIFEPFFTTEAKGNGLGLYLARELCEANQASLHLISYADNGCCFRIHFSPPQLVRFRESNLA